MLLAFFIFTFLIIRRANKHVSLNFDKLKGLDFPVNSVLDNWWAALIESMNKTQVVFIELFCIPALPECYI